MEPSIDDIILNMTDEQLIFLHNRMQEAVEKFEMKEKEDELAWEYKRTHCVVCSQIINSRQRERQNNKCDTCYINN